MPFIKNLFADAFHLFYPHHCIGCGSDLITKDNLLCINCIDELPHTNFASHENNYIENIFRGRMNVKAAHSEFYFSKGQLVQHLIHQLKYKANKEIGFYMGEMMGNSLLAASRFSNIDYLVPVPLYIDKEFKRGYNQSTIICDGIEASTQIPLMNNNIIRQRHTETQTRKNRSSRWQNVANSFVVKNPATITGKNILLIDDVITTGASLEACGQAILQVTGTSLSIAALAHATK
ncbi:MAG: ComF family protein [Ferruginibacter sp.]